MGEQPIKEECMSEVTQHWVDGVRVGAFGREKPKVAYRIEVGIDASDPIELKRKYDEAEGDWLASEAANKGGRMANEGFWISDDDTHIFIPAHRVTYVSMEKEGE
jgi:hypothetical protein